MKERSLIAFTLLAQTAVGAFWTLGALYIWLAGQTGPAVAAALTGWGWPAVGLLMGVAMAASFFHLGTPANAWRAVCNLSLSWLSREILAVVCFAGASVLFAGLHWFGWGPAAVRGGVGGATALAGLGLIYIMGSAYRLRTVPAWDTWLTPVSFFTTAFLLGGLAVGACLALGPGGGALPGRVALRAIALGAVILSGVALGLVSLWLAQLSGSEAASASALRLTVAHGRAFRVRLIMAVAALAAAAIALLPGPGIVLAMPLAFGLAAISELLGRRLFYEAYVRQGV